MTKTYDTFLPIFSGFYNTIWDESDNWMEYELNDEECFREHYPEFDGIPFDFIRDNFWDIIDCRKGFEGVVDYIVSVFPRWFNGEVGSDIIKNVTFQKIVSPREYNFYNDSADVSIEVDTDLIAKYLEENGHAFSEYLKKRYTSRDGFISHYSNDISEWAEDTNDFYDFSANGHYLGAILEFIANDSIDDAEMSLFYSANTHEGFSNSVEVDTARLVEKWEASKD